MTVGSRLADIGTDHGYIPIELVQTGVIPSAIAMDVNKGPLSRAKEHIETANLSDRISTRLSDGTKELREGEADCVIIAGMGGMLMMHILEDGRRLWNDVGEWILQPQSDLEKFRRFLHENGFAVTDEDMVLEDGKFYPMMRAVFTGRKEPDLFDIEYLFGAGLLKTRHPVLKEYLFKEKEKTMHTIARLEGAGTPSAMERFKELVDYLSSVEEALNIYEM